MSKVIDIRELRHPKFYGVLEKLQDKTVSEKDRWILLKCLHKKTINVGGVKVV